MDEELGFVAPLALARKLRNQPTAAESALWQIVHQPALRSFRFRRQYRFGRYFADFAAPAIILAIEVDGESHERRIEEDEARDRAFADSGWLVLRFRNEEVIDHSERVAEQIRHACEARPHWRY